MQETYQVKPGECVWLRDEGKEEATTLTVHYRIPIMGHVSVWFTDPIFLPGPGELKHHHFLTVASVLQIAKVIHRDRSRSSKYEI